MQRLPKVRAALAESLRLYPQPPILIRRALGPDTLPGPLHGDPNGYPIDKGADIFISVWNLHRWGALQKQIMLAGRRPACMFMSSPCKACLCLRAKFPGMRT